MEALAKRLQPLTARPGVIPTVPATIHPVASDRGHPVKQPGPVVIVGANGALSWNGRTGTPEQLADYLRLERARAEQAISGGMLKRLPPVYVWLGRSDPAKALDPVRAAAPKGTAIELLVVGKSWSPPESDPLYVSPEVVSLRRKMAGKDASQRASILAKRIQPLVRQCKPLLRVFGSPLGASSKGAGLAHGAPSALEQCGCQVDDLDLLEFGILEIMGAYQRPVRAIPLASWPLHG